MQTSPLEKQLTRAREQLDNTQDFTVAVEEEFALLDPDTLNLTNCFEDVQALARGRDIEPYFAGELIASEAEVQTGRCENFPEAAFKMGLRREQLKALAEELGLSLGATGAHPWSLWQEQRIIDTPHYRRNEELLQYVVWRNNTFGQHVHVAIRGADRAIWVANAMRNFLPELLALSASSPFLEGIDTGLHSVRSQIFTRSFPRCGVPDIFNDWQDYEDFISLLIGTKSIVERAQLWWSVRVHLTFPTVEVRIMDAQPSSEEAKGLAALAYALSVRCARAYDEGEKIVFQPQRLIEENLWRAIRWGLSGKMIDLKEASRGVNKIRSTRQAIEELIEWVGPVAEELKFENYLSVPCQNASERQIAMLKEKQNLKEIYCETIL